MMQTDQETTNRMLQYLYNEMSEVELQHFLDFLNENPVAMRDCNELRQVVDMMSSVVYSPAQTSLDRVNVYANFDRISPQ